MSLLGHLLALALLVFLSAVFSGSETGFYGLSRVRLETDARDRRRFGNWLAVLVSNERAFLITILIGNNLVLELATTAGEGALERIVHVPDSLREIVLTALLTPLVFLFGELLPKDFFRRRPHSLLGAASPLLFVARIAFLPLALPLFALGVGIERLLGFERREVSRAFGREELMHVLDEGVRHGSIPTEALALAQNALSLRSITVGKVMIPWREVEHLDSSRPEAELVERIRRSDHTRVPVRGSDGRYAGYLHQLDVLGRAADEPLTDCLRPLPALDPALGVDEALHRMRLEGGRVALVGAPEAPLGLLSLKDLVEEISGELADW